MSGTNNRINNSSWPVLMAGPILLSPTDLVNLSTVGKLLIPAPGVGFANIPFFIMSESSAGTGYSGSSAMSIVNNSDITITASTIFLSVSGTSLINSSVVNVIGATTATYTNLNNQGTYLYGGSLTAGGTQTVQIWIKYFIKALI